MSRKEPSLSRLEELILQAVARKNYHPVKPKLLAHKVGLPEGDYRDFRRALKKLQQAGRIEFGRNHVVRAVGPHGTVTGVFRKAQAGHGFVRTHTPEGGLSEIYIPAAAALDASTGDTVVARVLKKPSRPDVSPTGEVVQVVERATRQFVGTYHEREGQGYVRVDGTVFAHSIWVGDPGAKGARPDDKVVLEMLRFPEPDARRGEGVITEVLGPRGRPGVDTLSILREFGLPERFPEPVLEEARQAAAAFDEDDLGGREDFTGTLTVTIDPVDARDFDDAVSLAYDEATGHWQLGVHIADVAHFAPAGGELDREARKRATSVYLPQKVIPMFPEVISNSLASLQQGRMRYVKSVLIELTRQGQVVEARFAEAAIRVRRRFTYEEVLAFYERHDGADPADGVPKKKRGQEADAAEGHAPPARDLEPELADLLLRMRELALTLRERRFHRGALELELPEAVLEYDEQGRVSGAHFRRHDVSHQVIEEFMLAANEAVARHLTALGVPFLRRVHPAPVPTKLEAFAAFARILGYKIKSAADRFALQRVLKESASQPEMYAVHYALLRSLKQATYSPEVEEHFALAITHYCHFTSPIRRYPDLTVHRLLGQWLRTGRAGSDGEELLATGQHCSKMERRAELAERELVKVKLLTYMSERIGERLEVIITAVADYGFWAAAEDMPVEGLVHVATMEDDYYYFDEASHSLTGQRGGRRYRLGDRVHVTVVRVDLQRRQMDLRVVRGKRVP